MEFVDISVFNGVCVMVGIRLGIIGYYWNGFKVMSDGIYYLFWYGVF